MPVSHSDVFNAYRLLLGREPESDAAIASHLDCADLDELRRRFMRSREFRSSPVIADKALLPLDAPALDIETDAPPEQLEAALSKVRSIWSRLGLARPHFSVLTHPKFLPDSLSSTTDQFWNSGEHEAAMLRRVLARVGLHRTETMSCVEFGCGVGRVTVPLAAHFKRVHAYDISVNHLTLARERATHLRVTNIAFHEYSDRLQEDLALCEFFYSKIVFQHNPPIVITLLIRSALQCLLPNGIAIFQVPTHSAGYRFNAAEWLEASEAND